MKTDSCKIWALTMWLVGSLGILFTGPYPTQLALGELFEILQGKSYQWNAILDERLPRWIILSCSGASVAVAGAAMQALFANPLASASSLGISSGGSLFIIIAYTCGLAQLVNVSIPAFSFIGCLGTLTLVYALFRWKGGGTASLLLIGVAISTLLSAIESTLLYSIRDDWYLVRTLTEWASASSLDRSWSHVLFQLPLCFIALLGIFYWKREIDILSLGEEQALTLGIDVPTLRWGLFFLISLITGSTLAALGSLPFFGLLLPHAIRSITGPLHSRLLPLSALAGAGMLCLLDWLLRMSGYGVATLGNFCALFGAAGFLFLFFTSKEGHPSC